MAQQQMEPIQSFTYLVDNIPRWLTKLDDLNKQCDEQYERFYKLTRHGQVKLTRKKKHDSTESLRGKDKDNITVPLIPIDDIKEDTSNAAVIAETIPLPQPNTSAPLAAKQPTLKRKPTSILSAASDVNGYRTKSMIIVYYDSAIQEGFESIVKNISNARSNLRKGKTTATFQARMASMALPSEGDILSNPKMSLPSFGRSRLDVADKRKYKVFDDADRDLEEAQNLSERAAHQCLRDGDCKFEIQSTRKRLVAAQELAAEEVKRLRSKSCGQGEADVSKLEPTPNKGIENILNRTSSQMPAPLPPPTPVSMEQDAPKQAPFAATGTIEVDDATSDASSVNIDITAIRRMTRRA